MESLVNKNKNKLLICFGIMFLVFLFIVSIVSIASGGYIIPPDFEAKSFKVNDDVELNVNKLTSLKRAIPYSYNKLETVCKLEKGEREQGENLGEVLLGDRIEKSPFVLKMKVNTSCQALCTKSNIPMGDVNMLTSLIEDDYMVEWIVDDLPAAYVEPITKRYQAKFPLGSFDKEIIKYNNHFDLKILYNQLSNGESNIVFFEVATHSKDVTFCINGTQNTGFTNLILKNNAVLRELNYTYSVTWIPVERTWAQRWKTYMEIKTTTEQGPDVHWFSIANSILIVIFLSVMVAMILVRTLKKDIIKYTEEPDDLDETGWKYVANDVFRRPSYSVFFAVFVGSGVQVLAMAILTMVIAVLGLLSPAHRGSLMTALIILYVWMGLVAGYATTSVLKITGIEEWDKIKRATIMTAIAFPGLIFFLIFFLNLFLAGAGSSSAIPFIYIVGLIALLVFISIPLCFIGSYFANKKPIPKQPVSVGALPRFIPKQVWYMRPVVSMLIGGILPFGAVFIELYFILSSIWNQNYYYLFGFLFIVFFILVITCAEIAIVMCYFQLCSDDYQWWWRSYGTAGATGFYTFLYSIFYLFKTQISGFLSVFLYIGYSLILSLCVTVLTGTIGFFSCYYFVRQIYSKIHLD